MQINDKPTDGLSHNQANMRTTMEHELTSAGANRGPLHKILQAICGSNKKWIIIRFVALFAFSLVVLCCIYGLKSTKKDSDLSSADAHYAVGDSVYSGNLWLVIELESDSNGVRTFLGKAMALHVCSAIKASQSVGWTPLVVGGSSKCCRSSRCRHLHPRDLRRMKHFTTTYFLNRADLSSAMKSAAFLAAIQRGAHFIYHANPEVYYKANVSPEAYQEELEYQLRKKTLGLSIGLVKAFDESHKDANFNPYVHFGPSELRLDGNQSNEETNRYKICEIRPPSIEKYLEGDGFSLDLSAPPVTLPGKFGSPFDSRNTAFAKEAFWSLLLLSPSNLKREERDRQAYYMRSIMAQHVLKEISGSVKFSSSKVSTRLNVTNEIQNNQMHELSQKLTSWECSFHSAIGCYQALTKLLRTDGFLTEEHAKVVDLWIRDLADVGYEDIIVLDSTSDPHSPCIGTDALQGVFFQSSSLMPQRDMSKQSKSVSPDDELSRPVSSRLIARRQHAPRMIQRLCPTIDVASLSRQRVYDRHENLLLIIIFGNKEYHNIPLLEILYRHHFKNILYCGEPDELVNHYLRHFENVQGTSFTFMPAHRTAGYECLLGAVEMGYQVKGFLIMDQKTLINAWNFKNLDYSSIWHGNDRARNVTALNVNDIDPEGKIVIKSATGILKAFQFLEKILLKPSKDRELGSKSLRKREAKDLEEEEEEEEMEDEEVGMTTLSPEEDSDYHDINVHFVKDTIDKEEAIDSDAQDSDEVGPSQEFHISLFGEISPQSTENANNVHLNTANQVEPNLNIKLVGEESAVPDTMSNQTTQTSSTAVDHHVSELLFHPANFKPTDEAKETEEEKDQPETGEFDSVEDSEYFFGMLVDIEDLYKRIHHKLNLWITYKNAPSNITSAEAGEARELLQELQCDSSNNAEICQLVASFFKVLHGNHGETFQLFYDDLPVYYMPATYKEKLYLMANLLTKYKVANEMAFPLLLRGLSQSTSWTNLLSSDVITDDRKPVLSQPQDLLLLTDLLDEHSKQLSQLEAAHYLYPVDIKTVLTNEALRNVICRNY